MKIFIIGSVASMMINFRRELILELVNQNHEVYCLTSDYTKESKEVIKSFGAKPIGYDLNAKGINPFNDIVATFKLARIIKKYKPDVVFSFFVKPVIFATLAAKFVKTPRIVGMIEGLGGAFTLHKKGQTLKAKIIKFIQILLYKISLPLLDKLIFLNNDDKTDLLSNHKIKVKNVEILGGIGVDLNKFTYCKAPTDPISFIFIARLLAEKGIFEYLQAAKIIKSEFSEVNFYIFGGFEDKNPFGLKQNELQSYLKDGIVIYHGFVNNISEWLKNSSVFVLPSYREGVPRSTQEAMAIGRPIITTNVAGCKDTVKDGENGFLIPPYDGEILAQKMLYFLQNPNEVNRMGKNSRKMAEERFDIFNINKKLIKFIIG